MYSEKKIEEKCYQLNPELRKANLVVKVFQNPKKIGYDIDIFKEEDKYLWLGITTCYPEHFAAALVCGQGRKTF